MSTKKVNFLNNKDMLIEIHKSKITYSEFDDEKYTDWDFAVELESLLNGLTPEGREAEAIKIATAAMKSHNTRYPNNKKKISDFKVDPDTLKIHETMVDIAKENRADRLTKAAYKDHLKENPNSNLKLNSFKVCPDDINEEDLVFRFMTYEHIPLDEDRKKNPKNQQDFYVKLNFPPFKHYVLTKSEDESDIKLIGNLRFKEVGRSHSKDGEFSDSHGNMTNKLATMFILFVNRFSQKANWRGYTYLDEMKGRALLQLTEMGLKFDESKSDNPFAYYTTLSTNAFRRIATAEKKSQSFRDDLLIEAGHNPSYTRQFEIEEEIRRMRESAEDND
jgi:hypothetical protein